MSNNNFKVRVVKNISECSKDIFKVGSVIEFENGCWEDCESYVWEYESYEELCDDLSGGADIIYSYATEFELVTDDKDDLRSMLKSGMLVELTNGEPYMILDTNQGLCLKNRVNHHRLVHKYDKNLFDTTEGEFGEFDIYSIYGLSDASRSLDFETFSRELIWCRNNNVTMTMEEIKEKLGIKGELRIKGYEESWTSTEESTFPKDDKVVKIKYIGSFDKKEYEELGYRKHDNWYWYENDGKVLVEVIAWRNRQGE